jgi:NitT/TauT family transport system permease protein
MSNFKEAWKPILVVMIGTLIFELVLTWTGITKFVLPKPSLVAKALAENWPWLMKHLSISLVEAIAGFGLGTILGAGLAFTCLFLPWTRSTIVPIAIGVKNIPFVAISPILFVTLGYGLMPKVIIVTVVSFFPILVNLLAGFEAVNRNLEERFHVLKANRWQFFRKLQLPTAIPHFVTGIEIAGSNVVIAAIVGELLGTTEGLGYAITIAVSQYKFPLLMATVVVTTIASIGLTELIKASGHLAFRKWLTYN